MSQEFFAHSVEGKPVEEWHSLEEHLRNVAELAKKFGEAFNSYSAFLLEYLYQYSKSSF